MEDSLTQDYGKQEQLKSWNNLLEQQTALFRTTVSRNVELEARNEELEQELSVWKTALREAENEKKKLIKSVSLLQRNIDDNPLVLCLIDGDGNIFHPELIALGNTGGRQAAMMLTKGIMDHLQITDNTLAGRARIWLTIYCNLSGLLDTLLKNDICSIDQFAAFVLGFNQSSPLYSVVDVGPVKEAADSKLKEFLRIFTRFPQILKVFFGGGHDNGYASTLNFLQTEGLLHKIILLRGYKKIAYELRSLNIPDFEIKGVFMTHKMQANSYRKPTYSPLIAGPMLPVQPVQPQDFDKFRSKQTTPTASTPSLHNSSPTKHSRQIDSSEPAPKRKPLPCNFYYLAECRQGSKCHYGHSYVLSPQELVDLRRNAKKWPCPMINKGVPCIYGNDCVMGHVCSKGSKCSFAKQGKCKYIGKNMHPPINNSWHPKSPRQSSDGSLEDFKAASRSPANSSETEFVRNLLLPI